MPILRRAHVLSLTILELTQGRGMIARVASEGFCSQNEVNQCTNGFHGVNEPVAREDDRGVTKGREDVREVFQQRGSGAKRKLSRCGRDQIGNEPILPLPEGADDFVVYYDARSKDLEACLEKGRRKGKFIKKKQLDSGLWKLVQDKGDQDSLFFVEEPLIVVSIVMIRRMLGKVAKESLGIACGVAGCDNDVEEDDDMDDEEEEHPVLADSVPPPVHRVTSRISILAQAPTPFWSVAEVDRLLAILSPPPPASPTHLLGYRAAMIWLRAEAPYTSHPPPLGIPPSGIPTLLPIPAPTSSPSLLLLSTDHRVDALEVCLAPQKRLCISFGLRYEVRKSLSAPAARPSRGFRADYGFVATMDREIRQDLERDVGYGIIDTWDEMLEDMIGALATDETELGQRKTNFVTTIRQDTYEVYSRLADAQDARAVLSGRFNLLQRDRRSHAYTALLMER
ncbi:hypothetical protein Tco_1328306 [Tanacetum coccineum]